MPNPPIDLIAYRPDGSVVLLVEVKSLRGTSETWAAKLRRDMLSHGALPNAQFFLIATPDRIYGWHQQDLPPSEVPPQFLLDGSKTLEPYFQKFKQNPDKISPGAFELLVLTWLTDVARTSVEMKDEDPSFEPLVASGLLLSLSHAQIEMNSSR